MATIAVAGASGFIGRELPRARPSGHRLVGIARTRADGYDELRACDLFSLRDAEESLEGVDCAFYLVPSVAPSARMIQGSVDDLALICADNFARAARTRGVRQIVTIGSLLPDPAEVERSRHLRSQREIERGLVAAGVPLTVLRAGLVLGPNGSAFRVLENLVHRAPVLVAPGWTAHRVQPIALSDLVRLLWYVAARKETFGRTYDVGGPDIVTYRELMQAMASALGVRRPVLRADASPHLANLWVSAVGGTSLDLVGPLVDGMSHSMVTRDRRLQEEAGVPGKPTALAIEEALRIEAGRPPTSTGPRRIRRGGHLDGRRVGVLSVQRLPLPKGHDAAWVAAEYMRWLPRLHGLHAEVSDGVCRFHAVSARFPALLELTHSPARSSPDRQLFYITGGALSRPTKRGRLEFRETGDRRSVLVAIHEFEPRLPWHVYRCSQAQVHAIVMDAFGRHLASLDRA